MGLTAGIRFSYLLDGVIYIPSLSRSSRGLKHLNLYDRFIPLAEVGLFFPIGQNIIIDATVFKALQERFYTSFSQDVNGKRQLREGHSDFGFGVAFTYLLKGNN